MTSSAASTRSVTTPVISRVRRLAAAGMLGAALQIAGGVLENIDRVLPGEPQYVARTAAMGVVYLLFLGTLLGIEISGVAGHGLLAHACLVISAAGWMLYSVAQFVLPVNFTLAETILFPSGTVLIGLGMIGVGIAVLQAHRWSGWRRYVVLLCGLFPFVVIFPVFTLSGGPSFLALSAWGAFWLAVGIALWPGRVSE